MILDELKLSSDDSTIVQEHVLYLVSKYRAIVLEQKYNSTNSTATTVSTSNYQTLCLNFKQVPGLLSSSCSVPSDEVYLRSEEEIPTLMSIGSTRVYAQDYYKGEITLISKDRMRYVGFNKYLQNIIYASIHNKHLYLKSFNPQFIYLESAKLTGVFEDDQTAAELECSDDVCGEEESNTEESCDILDKTFPLEDELVGQVIKYIVAELSPVTHAPADDTNNASDDLSDLATYIKLNAKSKLSKELS